MLNRSIAPPITDAVNFRLELKPYVKFTLDNSVPVYATIHFDAKNKKADADKAND